MSVNRSLRGTQKNRPSQRWDFPKTIGLMNYVSDELGKRNMCNISSVGIG